MACSTITKDVDIEEIYKKDEQFSHIDFTICENIIYNLQKLIDINMKLDYVKLTTQRDFLIRLGIFERAEIISKNLSFSKKANIYYRIKRLIDKNQMGELFKVMFISSNKINFLTGFK